jgi:hypothetical protein
LICRKAVVPKAAVLFARYLGPTGAFEMMDVLMVALTFGGFALAIGYAYACERL